MNEPDRFNEGKDRKACQYPHGPSILLQRGRLLLLTRYYMYDWGGRLLTALRIAAECFRRNFVAPSSLRVDTAVIVIIVKLWGMPQVWCNLFKEPINPERGGHGDGYLRP